VATPIPTVSVAAPNTHAQIANRADSIPLARLSSWVAYSFPSGDPLTRIPGLSSGLARRVVKSPKRFR
jgi:hypothetical protein